MSGPRPIIRVINVLFILGFVPSFGIRPKAGNCIARASVFAFKEESGEYLHAEALNGATANLESRGCRMLVRNKKEPWGQTVSRFISPEG